MLACQTRGSRGAVPSSRYNSATSSSPGQQLGYGLPPAEGPGAASVVVCMGEDLGIVVPAGVVPGIDREVEKLLGSCPVPNLKDEQPNLVQGSNRDR